MNSFSKRETQILKGIAILLLMVHHGLDPLPKENMGYWGDFINSCVSLSKLCVAIFAILSGYGMYASFEKKRIDETWRGICRFVFSHIVRVYAVFWLVALPAIGIVTILKGNYGEIYEGHPIYYLLLDVMGLSNLADSPKFVNSWWYVTATLIYYCLFPLFFKIVQKMRHRNYFFMVTTAGVLFCFPGMDNKIVYGCFFLFGMIFAERDLLNHLLNTFEKDRPQIFLKEEGFILALLGLICFRQKILAGTGTEYYLDWLIGLLLLLAVSEVVCHIKVIRKGFLELTGNYSFEIYLVHGVFLKYFGQFIYRSMGCLSVLMRLFLMSFTVALLIRGLEKILHVERISGWCRNEVRKGPGRVAAILTGIIVVLMLPEIIANIGIGNIVFQENEIFMESGTWYIPQYEETPLFWDLADKKYSSGQRNMVSFVDGVLYSHYEGQTEVMVSLPFGKSASCSIIIENK